MNGSSAGTVDRLDILCARIPTDQPESDGTLAWEGTTIVVVEAHGAGATGLGYSYTSTAAGAVVADELADAVTGVDVMATGEAWARMLGTVRNLGREGVVSSAIAAVDTALWDLKARVLGVALADLLPRVRDTVPVYGSGGFTAYEPDRLVEQLQGWIDDGFTQVKLKVGRDPREDPSRVARVREGIGPGPALLVDGNGGYHPKDALAAAEQFAEHGVVWFEEPVSSDDLEGLRLVRARAPVGMEVTAGEYVFDLFGAQRLLDADAVDVLQLDATRCLGYTGFLATAHLAVARSRPVSAHTAPALHVPVCAAVPGLRHLEWFWDHVRIESRLFEGAPVPVDGHLTVDRSRPGHGLELRRPELDRYAV